VAWAAGDVANKTITLPIVDDALHELNETLTLTITPLTGGAVAGIPISLTLTILENDNIAPTATPQTATGTEDSDLLITLAGSDADADPLSYSITSLPAAGALYQATAGDTRGVPIASVPTPISNADHKVIFVPATDGNGGAYTSFTFTVNDGRVDAAAASVTVDITAINEAPTLDLIPDPPAINEDAGPQAVSLSGIGAGPANESSQNLLITATSDNPALIPDPTVTHNSPDTTGSLSFTPSANANGSATIIVHVADDGGTANGGIDFLDRTFTVNVTPVNDAPDFTVGPNQLALSTAGPQTVIGWARGFTPGPADEAGQTLLNYSVVSNSNPSLFAVAPAIDQSGTLTYTPTPGVDGIATIGVVVRDSGGTANGGVDTSAVHSFTISAVRRFQVYMPLIQR
jgi:large repetitive protein